MKKLLLVAALCFLFGYWVRAQNPAPYQFGVNPTTTVSNCAVTAAQTTYCFTGAGLYQSLNGAAFTLVAGAVSSVNGQTGTVVLAIPSKVVVPATASQTLPLQ